jgi:hypothetical protein
MDDHSKPDSNHAEHLSAVSEISDQHLHPVDEETNPSWQQPLITTSPEPDCDDEIAGYSVATSATYSGASENLECSIGIAPPITSHADHTEHPTGIITTATNEPEGVDDDW